MNIVYTFILKTVRAVGANKQHQVSKSREKKTSYGGLPNWRALCLSQLRESLTGPQVTLWVRINEFVSMLL